VPFPVHQQLAKRWSSNSEVIKSGFKHLVWNRMDTWPEVISQGWKITSQGFIGKSMIQRWKNSGNRQFVTITMWFPMIMEEVYQENLHPNHSQYLNLLTWKNCEFTGRRRTRQLLPEITLGEKSITITSQRSSERNIRSKLFLLSSEHDPWSLLNA
jgi:hypothetical protein